jgi:hypothetical protein
VAEPRQRPVLTLRPAYGDTSLPGERGFRSPGRRPSLLRQLATGPHLRRQGVWDLAVAHQGKPLQPVSTMGACCDDMRRKFPPSWSGMKPLLDSPTSERHLGPVQVETADRRFGMPIARRVPASPGARLVAGRYRLRALLGPRRYGQGVAGRGRAVAPTRRPQAEHL